MWLLEAWGADSGPRGSCGQPLRGSFPRVLDDAEGFAMSRYFFHIKDGAELIQDPEGSELATMADARSQALKSARELWADAIKSGRPLGADAVVIADDHGGMTFVPMAEALPKRLG
jgi:uncharacterized protein DUF6894